MSAQTGQYCSERCEGIKGERKNVDTFLSPPRRLMHLARQEKYPIFETVRIFKTHQNVQNEANYM